MDQDNTITVYRAGTFTAEPQPPWMKSVRAATNKMEDWDKALERVLGERVAHTAVEGSAWAEAEVAVRRTPGGGYFIDIMAAEFTHAEIWIPDPCDWLPFNASYVDPFLLARATIRQNECLDRLTNALIAFARHGEGMHINRMTGESRIDEREDLERRKRHEARMRATTAQNA
jgi:hypothetical protein